MAKQDVLDLVSTLSLSVADTTEISVYYDEVVRELGYSDTLVGNPTIDVTSGEALYTLPSGNIRTLEVHHNVTGRLDRSSGRAIRAVFGPAWALRRGPVQAFTFYDVDHDKIQLFPIPDSDGTLTIIQTEKVIDVPFEMELPVALEILFREFIRESNHQDLDFADACSVLSTFYFTLLGVLYHGRT